MSRDLNETLRRFTAAEKSIVKYKGLNWIEFEAFLRSLHALERICDRLTPSTEVANWLTILRYARRILRSAPVNPSHSSLQLEQFVQVVPSEMPDEIEDAFTECQKRVEALTELNTHPAWNHIETLRADAKPDARLNALVTKAAIPMVEELSSQRGWNLVVLDLTAAKKTDIGDYALIFGSPEFHVSWHFDFDTSSRMISWLFNSPIANETHVLSWPGNFTFDMNRYSAWDGAPLRDVSVSGSTSFFIDIDRATEISTNSSPPPTITDATTGNIEPVKATPIKLTEDTWVFLSDEAGPSANFIAMDDFDVLVREAKSVKNLTPGMVLIIRDGDAGRSFLEEEAGNWIAEKYGAKQRDDSLQARSGFRTAVQVLGQDQFAISRLKTVGLDEDHARRRLRLAHDRDHIAPQDKDVFEAICNACNYTITANQWSHIVILRTAYRQAGHRARKQLEEAIQADTTWQGVVETPAQAKIARKGLGAIVLAPIIEILTTPVDVPISRLGHLEKSKGKQ